MAMDFTKSKNASNLKKIQQKSVNASNSVVAIDVPLDEIDKNPENERIFNMQDIQYLADGINDEGFFGAIEVYKKPDGRYEISAGHRRYEAMKLLKKKTIPCIVKELPDDLTRGKKLLTSNMRNRKLSPLDMSKAIAYYERLLKESKTLKNFKHQACEFFNISPSQLYRFQCLQKISPELQQMANDPAFPFSAFREAVELNEAGQKELYKQLTFMLEGGSEEDESDEKELRLTRAKIERTISNLRQNSEYCLRAKLPINQKKEKTAEEPQKDLKAASAIKDEIGLQDLSVLMESGEDKQGADPFSQMAVVKDEKPGKKEKEAKPGVSRAINLVNDVISRSERIKGLTEDQLARLNELLEETVRILA